MSAPTPLRVAMEAGDHAAVVDSLAEDVVLRSPIFEKEFRGRDEASDLFAVLIEVLEELTYVAEIPGDPHMVWFRAKVKGTPLEGVDLLRFDQEGKVEEITVLMRPFPGIAAFISATGGPLGRRRGGAGRAALISAANPPVTFFMRRLAGIGPRLLKLRSASRKSA